MMTSIGFGGIHRGEGMMTCCGHRLALALGVVAVFLTVSYPVLAAQPEAAKVPSFKLTPEEIEEKEGRKACKIQICAAFRRHRSGPDIACNVTKTWRKVQLEKYASKARVSWPWGKVRCISDIKIPRQQVIDAVTQPTATIKLDEHHVTCSVDREKEPATIRFSFKPMVEFKAGKAVKASLNWGAVEAPTLVKGVMWTAKTTDNTFNVLQSSVVEDINTFITTRCDEVKADWDKIQ